MLISNWIRPLKIIFKMKNVIVLAAILLLGMTPTSSNVGKLPISMTVNKIDSLEYWKQKANEQMNKHVEMYISAANENK
jgi:hypothetical protein